MSLQRREKDNHASMYQFMWNRRTNSRFQPTANDRQKAVERAQLQFPIRMKETVFNLKQDKIFASDWINDISVLAGTKDNKLLLLDQIHNNVFEIPLIEIDKLQYQPIHSSYLSNPRKLHKYNSYTYDYNYSDYSSNHYNNDDNYGNINIKRLVATNPEPVYEKKGLHDDLILCDPLSPTSQQISRFSSVLLSSSSTPAYSAYSASASASASASSSAGADTDAVSPSSGCQGIRCVATSPNGCYVAVALADPAVVMVYQLPTMRGVAIAEGHRDAVFSVVWIDEDRFMTGSRDGSLRVWSVNDAMDCGTNGVGHTIKWLRQSWTSSSRTTTSTSKSKTKSKVRDLKLIKCNGTQTATSLTSKGTVQLWDINTLQRKNVIKLPFTQELVCLSVQPNNSSLIAVGSQAHITFADPRQERCAQSFNSQDEFWGVRSLAFGSEHILTCGGGRGRLSFIDTRMMEFLPLSKSNNNRNTNNKNINHYNNYNPSNTSNDDNDDNSDNGGDDTTRTQTRAGTRTRTRASAATASVYHNSSSEGWLDRDSQMYKTHFTGIQIPPAIYTTAYNSDGTKLFTAGGPIQSGLRGCYAAVWF
ncbi:WD40-repeat-containing domain protein [Phycomyces blakesleeanus]